MNEWLQCQNGTKEYNHCSLELNEPNSTVTPGVGRCSVWVFPGKYNWYPKRDPEQIQKTTRDTLGGAEWRTAGDKELFVLPVHPTDRKWDLLAVLAWLESG